MNEMVGNSIFLASHIREFFENIFVGCVLPFNLIKIVYCQKHLQNVILLKKRICRKEKTIIPKLYLIPTFVPYKGILLDWETSLTRDTTHFGIISLLCQSYL
jgi:hypothetical protein